MSQQRRWRPRFDRQFLCTCSPIQRPPLRSAFQSLPQSINPFYTRRSAVPNNFNSFKLQALKIKPWQSVFSNRFRKKLPRASQSNQIRVLLADLLFWVRLWQMMSSRTVRWGPPRQTDTQKRIKCALRVPQSNTLRRCRSGRGKVSRENRNLSKIWYFRTKKRPKTTQTNLIPFSLKQELLNQFRLTWLLP